MENTDVTVSMGDIVVVKTTAEDGCPADSSKAPVILQLQPIPQGMREETGERDAATVALQTDQGATAALDEEVEFGYPITCGESKAILLFKKFVCPGINVRCVKYNEQLISPKQFVHLSGKATLKDWKRAIRLGGVMLRKMMDSGQIDFYQHSTVCTNTCRSTKFDLLISNTRCPLQGTDPPVPIISQGNGDQMEGQISAEDKKPEETTVTADWSPGVGPLMNEIQSKRETSSISEDTLSFWKGISDVGLIGEVVTNIRSELLNTLRGLQLRSVQAVPLQSDMAVLSNLAQVFGLLDTVKRTLETHRHQTDPSQEEVHSTLTGLEQQLEEQRKQAWDWLASAQALQDTPRTSSNVSKPPSKRPRLQQPASAALLSAGSQVAPQFTILSPMTFSPLGQPFTVSSLPLAQSSGTITLHPLGSQLVTRYMTTSSSVAKASTVTLHPSSTLTLLSSATVQDSAQLGALVSPVELVQLTEDAEAGGSENIQPQDRGIVEGTVVVQQSAEEEVEDESQTHTTVIEIDPAPGDHAGGALLVQGDINMVEAVQEGSSVLVHSDMVEVEEVAEGESLVVHGGMEEVQGGASVVLQGDVEKVGSKASVVFGHNGPLEEVSRLQVEQQGQLHSVQIVVIKNSAAEQQENK